MLRRRWPLELHSLVDLVEDDLEKGSHPVVEGIARAGPSRHNC